MIGWFRNIVLTWLQFLEMDRYGDGFLDNGYDELETVKRMGEEDLVMVGVQKVDIYLTIYLSIVALFGNWTAIALKIL